MSEYKYVVLEVVTGELTRDTPFIFPKEAVHDEFVEAMRWMYDRNHPKSHVRECISAGFVTIMDDGPHYWGDSETLRKSSRGEQDTQLIQMYDYGMSFR